MKPEAAKWIRRAHKSLRSAAVLLEHELLEDSVSRAYYAMFHGAKALLAEYGPNVSKHSAVIAAFGHDFAAERILDPEYHLYLREAFVQRNSADYDPDASFRLSDVEEMVRRARAFLAAVEEYLQAHPDEEPSP